MVQGEAVAILYGTCVKIGASPVIPPCRVTILVNMRRTRFGERVRRSVLFIHIVTPGARVMLGFPAWSVVYWSYPRPINEMRTSQQRTLLETQLTLADRPLCASVAKLSASLAKEHPKNLHSLVGED